MERSTEPVIKSGYMLKKSPVKHKGFQMRWFQLTPFALRYYKMHKAGKSGRVIEKKGELPMHAIRVVRQMVSVRGSRVAEKQAKSSLPHSNLEPDPSMLDKRIAIDFGSAQRQFLLKAPSVYEAASWVQILQLAMEAYDKHVK